GMSDTLGILINDDDTVGEYSTSDPIGIRSAPYTGYPRTYGDMVLAPNNRSIHFDGEIYAATIWRLWELFQGIPISKDKLYDYLIGGMNFTPAGPAMEDMRDGILAAVDSLEDNGTTASEHKCLVWDAFAQFGIGDGAEGIARGGGPFGASLKSVTESFELPPECTGDNTAPGVTITSPADDITVTEDVDVVFAANATDLEDDDTSLTNSITWTSDLDGDIGITGAGGSTSGLSVGVHTITASVTDSGGLPGNYSVQVEVTGGGEPPPPPPPGSGMHIGDLDVMATTSQGSTWTATVQITVYDSGENLLAGAEVSVGWTGSGPGETVCTTIDGQCSVTHSGIHGKKTTLTVNNITLDGYTYDAAANHDPESDSDGTAITVSKP
ncbi:MAG: M36 family metallopeptidase, partial [Proteobacteria bacterium]|nr:M36 family metallopeptidase [Pseudomonadota bacterium]